MKAWAVTYLDANGKRYIHQRPDGSLDVWADEGAADRRSKVLRLEDKEARCDTRIKVRRVRLKGRA